MADSEEPEPLTRGDLYELANRVLERTATPQQARQLVEAFVEQANGGAVDERLTHHVRDCFEAFLSGRPHSLDQAFGLVRDRRGQPALDEQPMIEAAAMVLNERLAGATHLEALAAVETARREAGLAVRSERHIGTAWQDYKHEALRACRMYRAAFGEDWKPAELRRLRRIFAKSPSVVFPDDVPPAGTLTQLLAAIDASPLAGLTEQPTTLDAAAKNSGNS